MSSIDKLLVPTDFSMVANNALSYATEVSQHLEAELVVYHALHVPSLSQLPPYEIESREEVAEQEARKEFENLYETIPGLEEVTSTFIATIGPALDEILKKIQSLNIDLCIMGTHGASGIAEKLLGSNTASILTQASCPVLAVPAEAQFNGIRKIAFATDYGRIQNYDELDLLVNFAKIFEAEIHVVKVEHGSYVPQFEEAKGAIKFDQHLEPVKHSYHLTSNDNIEEGLQDYIQQQNIDLLAMMPRQHNIFKLLFQKSITRKMVYHTTTPVFGFHGDH